jgi:hypothetical protein
MKIWVKIYIVSIQLSQGYTTEVMLMFKYGAHLLVETKIELIGLLFVFYK